jgi:uncharacterized protein
MAFQIEERFVVKAPAERVWAYLSDPPRVVRCLPGAELTEVVDEKTFHGNVKVKVGPVTVSYKGKVVLAEKDPVARRMKMLGEGRETTGAGSAKMAMTGSLSERPGGETEVVIESEVDVVGRIVQLGRGMIEQVGHQIFQQFAACVRATLEAEGAPGGAAEAAAGAAEPVHAIPLLLRAVAAAFLEFLRRILGGKPR